MPLRTTDGRLLCGAEHAREILAICASLRRTAEGDGHGSYGPAVLRTGCAQVLHHCWCSIRAIRHPRKHIRRCACTTRELRELVVCLQELAVEHVAMESTGFMGSRCGTFSKATFKSCWPTHSILRQSPAQDGHQGLSVDRGTFAARTLAGQLHSPGADS